MSRARSYLPEHLPCVCGVQHNLAYMVQPHAYVQWEEPYRTPPIVLPILSNTFLFLSVSIQSRSVVCSSFDNGARINVCSQTRLGIKSDFDIEALYALAFSPRSSSSLSSALMITSHDALNANTALALLGQRMSQSNWRFVLLSMFSLIWCSIICVQEPSYMPRWPRKLQACWEVLSDFRNPRNSSWTLVVALSKNL